MTNRPKAFSVSYSRMSCFRRCLQQYHWRYIDKYYPPFSMGQVRGSAGHAALASWHTKYEEEAALQAAWSKWVSEGFTQNEEWDLLSVSLTRYFSWSRANDTFKLLEAEKRFDIQYLSDGKPCILTGYIDGIVEEKDGRIWLLENKFYKRMDGSGLEMDQQVSTYLLAAHTIQHAAVGVIYNMVRVADTKIAVTEPVVRKRIFRNPAGLRKIETEMLSQVANMLRYQEGGEPYRNATKDCHWDCSFYSACLSMLDDGQVPTEILQSLSNTRSTENG